MLVYLIIFVVLIYMILYHNTSENYYNLGRWGRHGTIYDRWRYDDWNYDDWGWTPYYNPYYILNQNCMETTFGDVTCFKPHPWYYRWFY
jgi:hypothetical protein